MFWGKLTYRKKNIALLTASALFALMAYNFTIRDTFELWRINHALSQKLKAAASAGERIRLLESRLAEINAKSGRYLTDAQMDRKALMQIVSGFCHEHRLVLMDFPSPTAEEKNGFLVETHILVVKGSYHNLMALVYQLEQELKVGKVASLVFEKQKDRRTKREELLTKVYLQSIKQSNYES